MTDRYIYYYVIENHYLFCIMFCVQPVSAASKDGTLPPENPISYTRGVQLHPKFKPRLRMHHQERSQCSPDLDSPTEQA